MTILSPFRANQRWMPLTSAHLITLFFILRFSTPRLMERQKKKMDAVSLPLFLSSFSLFQLENTGCSPHPSPTAKKVSYFCCLFIHSCLLDQSFYSCDKQTDKWMDVTSFRLLIYKQTRRLFFKRKLYGTF